MNTWWLAIDRQCTSYLELKHRKVVAQGWPDLDDLKTLCPLVANPTNSGLFQQVVGELEMIVYRSSKSPNIMWNLMRIQTDDLVIGIEGTVVKGICQMAKNGWESYHYDYRGVYSYAQTVGFPVEWIDWDPIIFGFVPTPPAQSVSGIAGLVNQHQAVVDAWNKYKQTPSVIKNG